MDVIYPVRPGENNEELRYSLRSLAAHLPHDRVWIVGHKPAWVRNVEFIPGNASGGEHANIYDNLRAAAEHQDVTDDVVIFNDDFFVTEPVDEIPVLVRATLAEHIANPRVQRMRGWWLESLQTTEVCLQAHGVLAPMSYELHVPFVADKGKLADTLALFQHVRPDNPPQWRTLYGNLHHRGGSQIPDVKCYTGGEIHTPFHSTEDRSWPAFHTAMAALFPDRCRYEHG